MTGTDEEPHVALSGPGAVPDRVCWKAFKVAGFPSPCWECWDAGVVGEDQDGCEHEPPPERVDLASRPADGRDDR